MIDPSQPVAEPVAVPVAVPQQVPPPVAVGVNQPAPSNGGVDHETISGFAKIQAERRSRVSQQPVTVPFGAGHIRLYRSMPAEWAYLAAEASTNPSAAFAAIREAIVDADKPQFDRVRKLPPDNDEGIDGEYLVAFLDQLAEFYGAVPTHAS